MSDRDLNYYLSLSYRIVIEPDVTGGMTIYIPDLPGCISQGDNLEDAFKMIEDAKKAWIETALEDGADIPEPVNEDEFSGKFVVRVPKSLHKILSKQAKQEGVSLNQYINYKLAKDVTYHPHE
jgi:antitoxin HicB